MHGRLRHRILIALSVAAFAACGGGGSLQPASSSAQPAGASKVSGTVSYQARMALPPSARVEVSLQDVSDTDAGKVSSTSFLAAGAQPPLPWSIVYDPAEVDVAGTYVVAARIMEGDKVLFRTPTPTPVITQGAPVSGIGLTLDPA